MPTPLQQPAVNGIARVPERAAWRAIAGDDQDALHAGLAVEPRQKIVERAGAFEIAHRDMRHRLETGGSQTDRSIDGFLRRASRHRADIDAGTGREHG